MEWKSIKHEQIKDSPLYRFENLPKPIRDIKGNESFYEFYKRYFVWDVVNNPSRYGNWNYQQAFKDAEDYLSGITNKGLEEKAIYADQISKIIYLQEKPKPKQRIGESINDFAKRLDNWNEYYFITKIIREDREINKEISQEEKNIKNMINYKQSIKQIAKCVFAIVFLCILYLIALNGRYENIGPANIIFDKWERKSYVAPSKEIPLIYHEWK